MAFDAEAFAARLRQHLAAKDGPTMMPVIPDVEGDGPYRRRVVPQRDPVTGLMTSAIIEPVARVEAP